MKKSSFKLIIIIMTPLFLALTMSCFTSKLQDQKKVNAVANDYHQYRDNTKGVIIHNDASTLQGSQYRYLESYNDNQLARGFAHYYVASGDIYYFHDDSKVAWHAGNYSGNTEYVGIEATGSMGNVSRFLENEKEALKVAAKVLDKYGLQPDYNTVRLHKEFYSTACPHRSWELHGRSVTAVKDYFISQIKYYMNQLPAKHVSKGYIDSNVVRGNTLEVKGWHISSDATVNNKRYAFVMDNETHKELARMPITSVLREDVGAKFSSIISAKMSGFNINIPITENMKDKKIYIVTRYLPNDDANQTIGDMWFTDNVISLGEAQPEAITATNDVNVGDINDFKQTGDSIYIRGWHATSSANDSNTRYLFILEAGTNKELKRMKINNVNRPDVSHVYPEVGTSATSGFDVTVPLTNEMYGKKIYVVTRYSPGSDANQELSSIYFTDNTLAVKALSDTYAEGDINEFKQTDNSIHIRGWHATSRATEANTRYLFILEVGTNKELKRMKINNVNRPDVSHVYPEVGTSATSGFDVTVPLTNEMSGKKIYVVTRYLAGSDANQTVSDIYFTNKTLNITQVDNTYAEGDINEFKQTDNSIHIRGWHATSRATEANTRYLFILEAGTNKELKRMKINNVNRPDVSHVYPEVGTSATSGFDVTVPLTNEMSGKKIYVVTRYLPGTDANQTVSDIYFTNKTLAI